MLGRSFDRLSPEHGSTIASVGISWWEDQSRFSNMLTTIMSFRDPWEAHMFRLRLEAEGILAMVSHEHHVWMNWPYSTALGGVKVQVPTITSEAARAVWSRCMAGDYSAELDREFGGLDVLRCPMCGSTHFRRRPPLNKIVLLLASFFWCGVIFPLRRSAYRCVECGANWSD